MAAEFPGGVRMAELASVIDGERVLDTIATALGAREARELALRVPKQRSLLVVDNCEHVLEAAAAAVETLLRSGPSVRVLATAREPLRAEGEVTYRVSGLREAEQLFCERAGRAAPGFGWSPPVAGICRRLEGMPLAIELAAARAGVMSVDDIDRAIAEDLAVLGAGRRTADPRQRSLRAAIEWSYRLLSDAQQLMFQRLAIFEGEFSVEAATEVCGGGLSDPLGLLLELVDKSLVVPVHREGAPTRYRLLVALRQYATARLAAGLEPEALRRRHFDYYRQLVTPAPRPPHAGYFDLLGDEMPNLRSALTWGLTCSVAEAVELAACVIWYWTARGSLAEALQVVEAALAIRAGDPEARASLLWQAGIFAIRRGDAGAAFHYHEEGILLYRRLGNSAQLARMLSNMSLLLGEDAKRPLLMEAEEHALRSGDKGAQALVLINLAEHRRRTGDLAAARSGLEAGLALRREAGDPWGVAQSLLQLAHMAMDDCRQEDWARLLAEAMALIGRDDESMMGNLLYAYARGTGDPRLALRLAAKATELRRDMGETWFGRQDEVELRLAAARREVGAEAAAHEAVGAAMSLDEACREALDAG